MWHSKSFVSTVFTASSSGRDFISRNPFLHSSIRSNSSSAGILSWDCSILVTSSAPLLILIFILFPSHLQLLPPLKSWTPQSSRRVRIKFVQTPVNADILTSSYESQMFLMASRMVNPFQRVFNLLCPNLSKELLCMAAIVLQNYLLIHGLLQTSCANACQIHTFLLQLPHISQPSQNWRELGFGSGLGSSLKECCAGLNFYPD